MGHKNILWYGTAPRPGVAQRLEERGFAIQLDPVIEGKQLLGVSTIAVYCHQNDANLGIAYEQIRTFINHGLRIIMIAERIEQVQIEQTLKNRFGDEFPWPQKIVFASDLIGTNFDSFIDLPEALKFKGIPIRQDHPGEGLNDEEAVLVDRAFHKAEELHVTPLPSGFSGSKVLIVYEKRRENSIAHWAQPRLVKIGGRAELEKEVGYMKAVAPFVPFELRPNLNVYVEGFERSVFVADFVEKSESMLAAAQAGRAEGAISNLFNRTLYRWRDRAWHGDPVVGSLAVAAERLGIIQPSKIKRTYRENARIEKHNFDFDALWEYLKSIHFAHRVASIHGDLHGDNVRVRGDDAILIDFGSVLDDAPLVFDVAMLEVALVFSSTTADPTELLRFQDESWEASIRPYYDIEAIRRTPKREALPKPTSWLFDCIHRIRAFGNYDQTDPDEYAIALVIALWRWCKWEPRSQHDKGRRVVALEIGAQIIMQIQERRGANES
jgi:hypothetical protein